MNLLRLIKNEQEGPLNYKETVRRGRNNVRIICILLVVLGCFLLGNYWLIK